MLEIILDFETKSACDITRGVDSYATDPEADILCACIVNLDPHFPRSESWTPTGAENHRFWDLLKNADRIWAHNARFDQGIYEYIAVDKYMFPEKAARQWFCSSHLARLNGLPASLDNGCRAAKVLMQKNKKDGDRLIRKMCIPSKYQSGEGFSFEWSPKLEAEMVKYCRQDVLATKDLINACSNMTGRAHTDWLKNEQVNDKGILIDMPLAVAAAQYVAEEKQEIANELHALTAGEITSAQQHQRFPKYVMKYAADAETYMRKYDKGVAKLSLDKEHLANLIGACDAKEIDLPDHVYNALQCKAEASGAATAKFKRMIQRSDDDGRVRGEFVAFGASTGRFSSRGIQFHNFKRDCFDAEEAETLRAMMLANQKINGAVIPTLGKMLRPTIIPARDHLLVVGDWSQVENRALPYLSNSAGGNDKLQLFRDIDADPTRDDTYVVAAKSAGLTDRQIGKVIELSLGYLGGAGAFQAMAKNYGVNLPLFEVEQIIKKWRLANKWAVVFGAKLTKASLNAVKHPMTPYPAGRVVYVFYPDRLGGSLICRLPCGTELNYAEARITQGKFGPEVTALKANLTPAADATEWPRYKLWAGVLMENVTSGFCASLLRDLLTRVDDVILHCHDEVALEVLGSEALAVSKRLQKEMENTPLWARGLPLKAEPAIMTRYGKA